jgi:hypothetical protein
VPRRAGPLGGVAIEFRPGRERRGLFHQFMIEKKGTRSSSEWAMVHLVPPDQQDRPPVDPRLEIQHPIQGMLPLTLSSSDARV